MRPIRIVLGLSVLPLVVAATGTAPVAGQAGAPSPSDSGMSRAAGAVALRAAPGAAHTFVRPKTSRAIGTQARAATFRVTYSAGFTPAARRAFQHAVDLWAPRITSSVPITVSATFEPSSPGNLGSAGSSFIWRDFTGAPKPDTWYVDAIANKRASRQLDPSPDIVANFNSARTDWYFGTDGNTPTGRYDFTTVVMHELGHGLGFLGAGRVADNRGTLRFDGRPVGYDRFTENGAERALLGFPDNSTQLANQLRSNSVFFDSPKVRAANGGLRARLYAPKAWAPGSSYSHFNEATYKPGTVNSMMTPFLSSAEAIHNPGPITRAVFASIGW